LIEGGEDEDWNAQGLVAADLTGVRVRRDEFDFDDAKEEIPVFGEDGDIEAPHRLSWEGAVLERGIERDEAAAVELVVLVVEPDAFGVAGRA
jgi:hypothetical protein